MQAWTRAFLSWLMESKNGREERGEKNNHGTFFDAQAASLALFVGDSALARTLIGEGGRSRIASQIDAEGKQALEIARTRPLHYSVFNLDAFTMLAEMGASCDVDLWHYTASEGGSIAKALLFAADRFLPLLVSGSALRDRARRRILLTAGAECLIL